MDSLYARRTTGILDNDPDTFADAARSRTAADLLAAFETEGVPSDHVVFENDMNRFFDDPLNRELGLVSALPQPLYGIVEQPGSSWHFGETPMQIERCCPTIGQHTDNIMREMVCPTTKLPGIAPPRSSGHGRWFRQVRAGIAHA